MRHGVKARAGVAAVVVSLSIVAIAAAMGAPAGAATTHNVSMVDFAFSPKSLTVQAGDTVMWTNNGSTTHTVTADNGSFNSGSLGPGQTFSHMFSSAGTVAYHCLFHGAAGGIGMAGTIVVRSASPATTAPPVTSPAVAPPPPTTPAAPGVSVAPEPTTAPPSQAAPSASGATVADTTSSPASPELAHTGSNAAGPALLAAVLLVSGVLALFAGRRRARFDSSR